MNNEIVILLSDQPNAISANKFITHQKAYSLSYVINNTIVRSYPSSLTWTLVLYFVAKNHLQFSGYFDFLFLKCLAVVF